MLPFLKLPEKLSHETVTGSTLKLNPLAVAQGRYSVSLITTASPAPSTSLISLSTTPSAFSPSLDNQKYRLVPYLCWAGLKYHTMRMPGYNVTVSWSTGFDTKLSLTDTTTLPPVQLLQLEVVWEKYRSSPQSPSLPWWLTLNTIETESHKIDICSSLLLETHPHHKLGDYSTAATASTCQGPSERTTAPGMPSATLPPSKATKTQLPTALCTCNTLCLLWEMQLPFLPMRV